MQRPELSHTTNSEKGSLLKKKKRIEKMSLRYGISLLMVTVAVVVVGVRGQSLPSCASELIPCQEYINSTAPPVSCCGPLKNAVETEAACLCKLFQDEELFKTLRINRTAALELPKHCGITADITTCSASTPSQSPTAGGDNKNGASKMALIEVSGLAGLLLVWVSMLV